MSEATELYKTVFVASGGYVDSRAVATSLPHMGGGFGVVAKRLIREDEIAVSVPVSLTLTASYCRKENRLPSKTPPIISICLYLMRMRLRCIESFLQTNKSNSSHFASTLYPNECLGLSLSHFRTLSPYEVTIDPMRKGKKACFSLWISRLPSQYDSIAEIHPNNQLNIGTHHTFSSNSSRVGTGSKEEIYDETLKNMLTDDLIAAWEQETNEYTSNLYLYLLPLIGSKRHCHKIEKEILAWRSLALQYSTLFPKIPIILGNLLKQRKDELPERIATKMRTKKLLIDLFGWAYCTLMSRGFSSDEEVWMMIPWVDYFNFSHEPNLWWEYNENQKVFEFKALRDIKGGEEILLNYCSSSDLELLTWYGFILCNTGTGAVGSDSHSSCDGIQQTHQKECCYILSPLVDANGEYYKSSQWLEEIMTGSLFFNDSSLVNEFCTEYLQKEEDIVCSVNRQAISAGLYSLVCCIALWTGISRRLVLTRILLFELLGLWNLSEKERTKALTLSPELGGYSASVATRSEFPEVTEKYFHLHTASPVLNNCRAVRDDMKAILFLLLTPDSCLLEEMLKLHDK